MKSITYAIRVLLKNKFYSFLNIFGLAIGLSVAMIILLYVQSDLTFDQHHKNYSDIYRIEANYKIGEKDDRFALTSRAIGPILSQELPEILSYTRFQGIPQQLFRMGDRRIYQDNLYFADSTVFQVFTHEFIYGDPETALDAANTIVLTESTARKFFGNANPINELMKTDNLTLKVTGVIKDLPDNVHLTFDGLISDVTNTSGQPPVTAQQRQGQLWNIQLYTYILLPKGYDAQLIRNKWPELYDKHMKAIGDRLNASFTPMITPLDEVHFNSTLQYDLPTGNKAYTRAFTAIGIFILLLASINYMNLATARATSRSKEVGVRKVLGSTRTKLVSQFLSESIVITFFSMLLAILMVNLILHGTNINSLMDKDLQLDFVNNRLLLFGSLGITVFIGVVSGLYPAFYLSAISVLKAMKGAVKSGPKSVFLRKALVTFQFFVSIGVVISTLLMNNQISFMRNKDLGFNKDNVIVVPMRDTTVRNRTDLIKAELLQNPDFVGITDALGVGISGNVGNSLLGAGKQLLTMDGSDTVLVQETVSRLNIGKDYVKAMQMEIVAGRDFDETKPTDITRGVLVNEALVKKMGWTEPIGKRIGQAGSSAQNLARVIGVVKDFHAFSLHTKVEPTVMFRYRITNPQAQFFPSFLINVKAGTTQRSLDYLERRFTELDPNHPFEYQFLDIRAKQLYEADQKQSRLTGILSYICILISCLGLLGLASFTTATRIKEIGVRKVLGATVPQLVFLIFRDIMFLVIAGFVVAAPVAYYFIDNWLLAFEYKMNLQTLILTAAAASGVLALIIAFLTVSFHSLKAARQNPVRALRYE